MYFIPALVAIARVKLRYLWILALAANTKNLSLGPTGTRLNPESPNATPTVCLGSTSRRLEKRRLVVTMVLFQ